VLDTLCLQYGRSQSQFYAINNTSAFQQKIRLERRLAMERRAAHAPELWVAAILGWWTD
jgi:hypothetical protein